jgi:hypothetical protein
MAIVAETALAVDETTDMDEKSIPDRDRDEPSF